MNIDELRRVIADKDPTPNTFTYRMGEFIRKAREEKGISQSELAERVYRRQGTISDWETGKTEVGTSSLILLAAVLDKPITYFFETPIFKFLVSDEYTALEEELLLHFRRVENEHLQKIAIEQVRVLGEFDPETMVIERAPIIAERLRHEKEIEEKLAERKKK